jgi:hypothetical protein
VLAVQKKTVKVKEDGGEEREKSCLANNHSVHEYLSGFFFTFPSSRDPGSATDCLFPFSLSLALYRLCNHCISLPAMRRPSMLLDPVIILFHENQNCGTGLWLLQFPADSRPSASITSTILSVTEDRE